MSRVLTPCTFFIFSRSFLFFFFALFDFFVFVFFFFFAFLFVFSLFQNSTAHAAKENEQRSKAMFESTEELMKFQFMSMSLSYFSSLNMLKTMRDINSDTTSAAIASSAQTAAAAAAAAAAANIPELKHLKMGTADLLDASTKKKKARMIEEKLRKEEAKKMLEEPFPEDITVWTVDDVCRWLDTISLSQYKRAFREGSVDGSFLTELRSEDLRDILGMEHELHRKKVLVMINKMKPLDQQETMQREIVLREEGADEQRTVEAQKETMPTLEQVFSMCRNGRFKRLSEALDLGFPVDTADQYGNTLLLLASQQTNQRIVEMLLDRRANINHQNNLGNTPLHYAMYVVHSRGVGRLFDFVSSFRVCSLLLLADPHFSFAITLLFVALSLIALQGVRHGRHSWRVPHRSWVRRYAGEQPGAIPLRWS